jgi:hypothetical protein
MTIIEGTQKLDNLFIYFYLAFRLYKGLSSLESMCSWVVNKERWLASYHSSKTYQINMPTGLFGHSSRCYHLFLNMPATL